MSYILDALQKSSAVASPEPVSGIPPVRSTGLPLPWKVAIGAVLAANLLLLYLWRTDQAAQPETLADNNSAAQVRAQQQAPLPSQQTARPKKTLPGIASPRPTQPPAQRQAQAASGTQSSTALKAGTARVFKPSGAPITIAQSNTAESAPSPKAQPAPLSSQPTRAQPRSGTSPSSTQRAASRLSQLSDGAREALYALSFSTHIYGSDSDLRAVVVNGQRLTEGNSVTADNGQEFLLLEIIDNGVIIQFEHEGATESVEIPVMEDWKEA